MLRDLPAQQLFEVPNARCCVSPAPFIECLARISLDLLCTSKNGWLLGFRVNDEVGLCSLNHVSRRHTCEIALRLLYAAQLFLCELLELHVVLHQHRIGLICYALEVGALHLYFLLLLTMRVLLLAQFH